MADEMCMIGNQQSIIAANPLRRYNQFQAQEAPAGRHLCSWKNKNEFKLRQERHGGSPQGLCRPDGAGEFYGRKFYKDFAPDGAGPHTVTR